MQKLTRHTQNLEFANKKEMTFELKEQKGYKFTTLTKDSKAVELFVYKIDGFWTVNELTSNAMLLQNKMTRKDAISTINIKLKRIEYEKVEKKINEIKEYKKQFTTIN